MTLRYETLLWMVDFYAFSGWMGVWIYLRRWPHSRFTSFYILTLAMSRLWEGLMEYQGVPVPPWATMIHLILQATVPVMVAVYLHNLQVKARIELKPPIFSLHLPL